MEYKAWSRFRFVTITGPRHRLCSVLTGAPLVRRPAGEAVSNGGDCGQGRGGPVALRAARVRASDTWANGTQRGGGATHGGHVRWSAPRIRQPRRAPGMGPTPTPLSLFLRFFFFFNVFFSTIKKIRFRIFFCDYFSTPSPSCC